MLMNSSSTIESYIVCEVHAASAQQALELERAPKHVRVRWVLMYVDPTRGFAVPHTAQHIDTGVIRA